MLNRNSKIQVMTGLILAISITAHANWSETFGGNAFDLTTWKFYCYPDVTKTFRATIKDGAANNDYLSISETTSVGAMPPGSAFGMGFGSDEVFRDVRVGAVFNVTGDASRNYHGLAARASYFIDPDGSLTGAPGIVASAYIMIIHYEDSPANLRIELLKIVNLDDQIMQTYQPEVPVPGLDHARSHYVELDVVGSDPVYITGSIYQYKGGPLLVRTPTFIDTSGNDPWERKGIHDNVFASGPSGIFNSNENPAPVGYHTTFDDVFSISDGPAAVNPSPTDGAMGVSIEADLSWVEAAFATSRQLWFGKAGAMQKMAPAPAGKTYDPGTLEFGQTYQWRVDEVGTSSTVTGHTWTFTTGQCLPVDDFESYADDAAIQSKWVHNIAGGYKYVFVDTGTVNQGAKSMRFEYQNQYAPYLTQATNTFTAPQDWTRYGVKALSLAFRGINANVEQPMFIRLEDAAGKTATVTHPYAYAVESEPWRQWDIALTEFSGVNLAAIKKITIGVGNETNSGQALEDRDSIYIDNIRLCPARCFNVDQIDLRADINGDCVIDLADFAAIADGWLNDGLSVVP
jgi:hypothetical protein